MDVVTDAFLFAFADVQQFPAEVLSRKAISLVSLAARSAARFSRSSCRVRNSEISWIAKLKHGKTRRKIPRRNPQARVMRARADVSAHPKDRTQYRRLISAERFNSHAAAPIGKR